MQNRVVSTFEIKKGIEEQQKPIYIKDIQRVVTRD
jgi:hypothetical protein